MHRSEIWHRDSAVCTLAQLCTYINFVNDQKTDTDHITAEATFTMKNICLAYGVSFMDLEVDVPVGKVKIRKVYCLQDSGKIINPQLAEGQMHGGVAMGIGYALGEQMLFDAATGRPLNNNLLDYKTSHLYGYSRHGNPLCRNARGFRPLRSQGTGRAAPDSPGSGGSGCRFLHAPQAWACTSFP